MTYKPSKIIYVFVTTNFFTRTNPENNLCRCNSFFNKFIFGLKYHTASRAVPFYYTDSFWLSRYTNNFVTNKYAFILSVVQQDNTINPYTTITTTPRNTQKSTINIKNQAKPPTVIFNMYL